MNYSMQIFRGCTALAALLVAACASPVNGPEDNLPVETRFPITVEPQMQALRLPFNAARGLDPAATAELDRFARDYLENGSGTIAVSASRGNPNAAGAIADRLAGLGVPRDRIAIGTSEAADAAATVSISYIRYQARAESCGNWPVNLGYTSANKPSPNFGCASQHNLAAMVADPRDLVSPKALEPGDAQRQLTILDKYRKGETTVAAKTLEQSGAVAEVATGGDKM